MFDDAKKIYEFIDAVNATAHYEELEELFGKLAIQIDFNNWGCIQISSGKKAIRNPLRKIFGKIPYDWFNHYEDNNFIFQDYAAQKVLELNTPFWWSEITDNVPLEKQQMRVFNEAKSFDLNNGLAIPLLFADGSIWSCLLTSEHKAPNEEITRAMALAAQFYARRGMYLKNQSQAVTKKYVLTKRQRQIVELLKLGNTQQECANLLQISHSTVFNQTNEAKERLGCKTIAHLVVVALEIGEIE